MIQTPFEEAGSLQVGTVEMVSSDRIEVALIGEAPESIALNAGVPRPFPRVNDYLLVPIDERMLVGQVESIAIDRAPLILTRAAQKAEFVDLPYPRRELKLSTLGALRTYTTNRKYTFDRGADVLPSVGAAVMLPTNDQLRAIVEPPGEEGRVTIGTTPRAGDAELRVDPNRLFGRHLAVLGNTGSGKSCSVAGLIRWSLEEAQSRRKTGRPNARFVVLDPNGEYERAFSGNDITQARVFTVNSDVAESALKVPLWLWNSAEWSSITRASHGVQRPLLRRALREVKAGRTGNFASTREEQSLALRKYLSSKLIQTQSDMLSNVMATEETKFGFRQKAILEDLNDKITEFPNNHLSEVIEAIDNCLQASYGKFTNRQGELVEFYRAFSEAKVRQIISALHKSIDSLGGIVYPQGLDEDIPLPFSGAILADHLEVLAHQENSIQNVEPLIARIRTLIASPRLKEIIDDSDGDSIGLKKWLELYIGKNDAENGNVSIIDLSLVPSEVIHIVTAVIARVIFEASQRYVKRNGKSLPTVLVMEEAHTFISRYWDDSEHIDTATICCQAFERIAREGRKFGLSLVLSSQRPHEISPTVLSQCNTFLLHRISNDRDQEIVQRLVPDNLRGLLRELPSLVSQTAILLGWATELPTLVRMNELPREQQPRSDDPEFWKVWTGAKQREIDWGAIVDDWQGGRTAKAKTITQ